MGAVSRKQEAGSRKQVLILHGWMYSTEKWEPFIKLLEAKGLKPELLAIPGLTADLDRPWTLDDYVEWLKKEVGKAKVILIGHSNGGRIALAFTIKYPELTERIILIDSAGIQHQGIAKLKRSLFKGLAKTGKKITSSKGARNLLHRLARVSDYKDATPQMRETMTNLISTDISSKLHKIAAPSLIIWGEKDTATPLSDAKLMHKLMPSSELRIIKDARHSPQFTHPKEVSEKIWLFLTR